MKKLLLLFGLTGFACYAQTITQCRQRFDVFLNFRGKLDQAIKFTGNAIYFVKAGGVKELAVYEDELPSLATYIENSTVSQQQKLYAAKGLTHYSKHQLDSLTALVTNKRRTKRAMGPQSFAGFRVAIDPGHFATNLKEAAAEQKYLYFSRSGADSVKLFESELTFATAAILKKMLEEKGATVMLTRSQANFTSFDCTYSQWIKKHRVRVLDSLKKSGSMHPQKHSKLLKSNNYNFFWDFFRDYDLANRAKKINDFNPHVTAVVHYNVDEKNAPWKKTSGKDFTMTFIGGAFTAGDIEKSDNRTDLLRLLITDQLNRSEQLASVTVANFNKNLDIKIAKAEDASYLAENCNKTSKEGVFCRNLVLCRKINSPLVYGEALYQDNDDECTALMKNDKELFGIKTNSRVAGAAQSYFDAIFKFLENY